ncbi:hypothetical protein ACGTNG_14535 [Halomonas sp. 1390]|uniref:hypothetical protein n=1 Tax=Halomonas sp. B23F22_3 TaxID=3459516 RepID=UPI00373E4F1B
MSAKTAPLPDRVTLEALGDWLRVGRASSVDVPTVEVRSIDQGYYLVRLHHEDGVSQLVDADGQARPGASPASSGRAGRCSRSASPTAY